MMRNEGRGTGGPWLDNGWVAERNDGTLRQSEVMQQYKEPGRRFQGQILGLLLSLLPSPPAAEPPSNPVARSRNEADTTPGIA